MVTLTLKKKFVPVYRQQFQWKLTPDMNDSIEKQLGNVIDDIAEVSLLVTLRNGEQKHITL